MLAQVLEAGSWYPSHGPQLLANSLTLVGWMRYRGKPTADQSKIGVLLCRKMLHILAEI